MIRLEAVGYTTLEFSHTTGTVDETVTKTLVAEIYEAKIVSVSLNKTVFAPGETITVSGTVKNTGNMVTNVLVKTYIGGALKYTKTVTSLVVGASVSFSGSYPVPSVVGSHVLKVTVEPEGKPVTDTKVLPFTVVIPTGTLTVTTTPTGARVGVNPVAGGIGESCLSTPCTFTLSPGDYNVKVEKPWYETITGVVTIVSGQTVTKSYTLVLAQGTLSVTTTPTSAGATVAISGITGTFTIPFTKDLAPGTYTLTITKTGYVTQTPSVTITAGTTTTRSYTLVLAQGTLSVTTTPTGASVDINVSGGITRTTPFTETLNVGTYNLLISKPTYDDISDTVTIVAGTTSAKMYTLVKAAVTVTISANVPASVYINGELVGTLS